LLKNLGGFERPASLFCRPAFDKNKWVVYTNKMDDYILKTIIFIMKDTKTNQPVVVSHFQGFKDDSEAKNFSEFLKDQFMQQEDFYPNTTLH